MEQPGDQSAEDKAAVEAQRREAALRALAAETPAPGAEAPPSEPPAGAGNRIGLYIGLAVLVVVALVAAVVLLSGGDDDTSSDGAQGADATTPTGGDSGKDEGTETTGTSTGDDAGLPAPVGDPPPDVELDGAPDAAAESILAYRQWAFANPAEIDVALVAQEGSSAFTRLTNETSLLVGGERVVVLETPSYNVTSVQESGDLATFAGTINWLRYSGFDVESGEVVEERAAGSQNVTGQLVRTPDGWKLTELTVT